MILYSLTGSHYHLPGHWHLNLPEGCDMSMGWFSCGVTTRKLCCAIVMTLHVSIKGKKAEGQAGGIMLQEDGLLIDQLNPMLLLRAVGFGVRRQEAIDDRV